MTTRAPETPTQAAAWAKVQGRALDYGLCHRCAAQVAWGSQNGFRTVKPPCSRCAELVAPLPVLKGQGWCVPEGRLSGPWKPVEGHHSVTAYEDHPAPVVPFRLAHR